MWIIGKEVARLYINQVGTMYRCFTYRVNVYKFIILIISCFSQKLCYKHNLCSTSKYDLFSIKNGQISKTASYIYVQDMALNTGKWFMQLIDLLLKILQQALQEIDRGTQGATQL